MKHLYTKIITAILFTTICICGTFFANSTYAGSYFNRAGGIYECTDNNAIGYSVGENKCYSRCFVEDTKVTMADGSKKSIQNIVVGDWLKGSKGPNRVDYLINKFNDGKIYGFNGGKKFVTDSHPFQTTQGWKSIDPSITKLGYPDLEVGKLEVGNVLITENGNIKIESIENENNPQQVYTFGVNGTHDYYADGYLVHNKYAWGPGCPAGWFSIEGAIYNRASSYSPYYGPNCYGKDLGAPVYRGALGGGSPISDVDIINLIYWDKNNNGIYDDGIDRGIQTPSYATSTSGAASNSMVATGFVSIYGSSSLWYNNLLNLAYEGIYTYGVTQSSTPWINLVNQGFTTANPLTKNTTLSGGVSFTYITGLNIGLQISCNGTGTQNISLLELVCPSSYFLIGSMCYSVSNTPGGPCTVNNDCSGGGTCGGYIPPNSQFKVNDGFAWNAGHPRWNDSPHGNTSGRCRNADEAFGCEPSNTGQVPNWYGGGTLCGCGGFIPNTESTPGSCSTTSANWIIPTENIVNDTLQCTGTGGGGGGGGGCVSGTGNISEYTVSPGVNTSTINFGGTGLDGNKTVRYHLQYTCGAIPTQHWEGDMTIASGATSGTGDNTDIATTCAGNMPVNREDDYIVSVNVSCDGCTTTTESPIVCDLNDPLMAGVCYIPGGYGTTVYVTNGMVGINTLTPAYPLDIDGTIRAAGVLTLSDSRLKSSIEKIDQALENIRKVNGYTFTWKDSGNPDLGVLAQEIEKVYANAVQTDKNGKKTVQYNALLAPIIEVIKELHTSIDSLSNERFNNQVKRIEAIEKQMK